MASLSVSLFVMLCARESRLKVYPTYPLYLPPKPSSSNERLQPLSTRSLYSVHMYDHLYLLNGVVMMTEKRFCCCLVEDVFFWLERRRGGLGPAEKSLFGFGSDTVAERLR
jgi:hypothetical protein